MIALPLDQVVLDFAPLGAPDADTNLVDGLLVASPREPVLIAVAAVEAAGLKVVRVDLSSFAVLRSSADDDLAVEAVIDIGAHLTTVVVHEHGVPKLVRTLTRGGEELTRRLAERLDITLEDAEEVKCASGLGWPVRSRPSWPTARAAAHRHQDLAQLLPHRPHRRPARAGRPHRRWRRPAPGSPRS